MAEDSEEDKCICNYLKRRDRLILLDKNYAIGYKIRLTERERLVNEYLMKYKNEEMDVGLARPDRFLAANHFFNIKTKLDRSKVFQFLSAMPKGASLHSHAFGMVSADYLYSLTFRENLWACVEGEEMILQFFRARKVPKDSNWRRVSELRESDPEFEGLLKSNLTLIRDDPKVVYPDGKTVWKTLKKIYANVEKLLTYKPVFEEYFYQVLKETYEDNVKYMEFRSSLPNVYDISGKSTYRDIEVVRLYWDVLTQFLCDHVDFVDCKFIFAPDRLANSDDMNEYVRLYKLIKEEFPRFLVGFDLAGEEDLGAPLINFTSQLTELQESGCKFFFHAGETHWNGQPSDYNLFEAIMFKSVRIGQGFALLKHPLLASLAKERGIGIEISPISNQVLKLIDDVRDHPGAVMIANNYPVVVVNDEPSFWGGKGLTYDWYMTFMGMCNRDGDLRLLKQLALNSIQYSALDDCEKNIAFGQFHCDWNKFITKVLTGCECSPYNKDCI